MLADKIDDDIDFQYHKRDALDYIKTKRQNDRNFLGIFHVVSLKTTLNLKDIIFKNYNYIYFTIFNVTYLRN